MIKKEIKILQPPDQLMSGFLAFAKVVKQKSIDKGVKFSEEELADLFNNSFSGQIRLDFFLWIGDLNRIVEGINIILSDLSELRKDKNSLSGNPVIRSELLLQTFFGEFFRIRESAKIFIKYLTKQHVLDNKNKEIFVNFYFTGFDWVYEIRNSFIHQGATFKNYDVELHISSIKDLSEDEKEKYNKLIKDSNTRENTVEIQCAIYTELIYEIMDKFMKFQDLLNNTLADLILAFEKIEIEIGVLKDDK